MQKIINIACQMLWIVLCAICWLMPAPALSEQRVRIVARITPQSGRIMDAALLSEHLMLLYPDSGQIADYTLDGKLNQHIIREGGMNSRFKPTSCSTASGELLVFDEADHKVFFISPDGNISQGIDLAFPSDDGLLALSRIGDLAYGANKMIYALLPERGVIALFDRKGNHQESLDLAALLPYSNGLYSRLGVLADGSLFVMDYSQGAVLYRRGAAQGFRRLRLSDTAEAQVAPTLQDFAVDEAGNVLIATTDTTNPLLLLDNSEDGYHSHALDLKLPAGSQRLACRYSGGKYIVWSRDRPYVIVLQVH